MIQEIALIQLENGVSFRVFTEICFEAFSQILAKIPKLYIILGKR